MPAPASHFDLEAVRLHPRFSVEQGVREDGTAKVRAVDHLSWSAPDATVPARERTKKRMKLASVNGHCCIPEQTHHDHLDDLFGATRLFIEQVGQLPGIWKADIDAAFRYLCVST